MDVEATHGFAILLNALRIPAMRGVDTRLTMDEFAVSIVNDRIALFPKFGDTKATQEYIEKADEEILDRLDAAGVLIQVTNPSRLNKIFPFVGRSHMKIFIADNNCLAWWGKPCV